MSLEGYEGTAIDKETFEQSENTEFEPESTEVGESTQSEVVETDEPSEGGETTEETIDSYDIPGVGSASAEEIREWKNGWLRQSDYTRKTQQLASERERLKDAETLFNYVSQHPDLIATLRQTPVGDNEAILNANPDRQMLRQVLYNQKSLETDMKLNSLRQQYGDIDEVAILNKAAELGTEDLDFVYRGLIADTRSIDAEALKQEAIEIAKQQLKEELESNKDKIGNTTVSGKQSEPVQKVALTPDQKRVANAMGMSEEEYAKWL